MMFPSVPPVNMLEIVQVSRQAKSCYIHGVSQLFLCLFVRWYHKFSKIEINSRYIR
jgi:hypothetical protein